MPGKARKTEQQELLGDPMCRKILRIILQMREEEKSPENPVQRQGSGQSQGTEGPVPLRSQRRKVRKRSSSGGRTGAPRSRGVPDQKKKIRDTKEKIATTPGEGEIAPMQEVNTEERTLQK